MKDLLIVVDNASKVLSVSEEISEHIILRKFEVISNAADTTFFQLDFKKHDNNFIVLFVGRFT